MVQGKQQRMAVWLTEVELLDLLGALAEALGEPWPGELTDKGIEGLEALQARLGALWTAAYGRQSAV
jgi:hypothetical protein